MINVSPETKQQALLFLARDQKVAAVKIINDQSKCGLKEAKDYVDALEGGVQQPITNLGNLDAELLTILNQGNKLNAIKHYKDATGSGLAESKDYVEKLIRSEVIGNVMPRSRDTEIKDIISDHVGDNQNPIQKFLIKLLIVVMASAALTYILFNM
ncbi:hypothetical protein [Pedobacter suwonensis]|uniref:hypothetical protein n=1 Tax=Pedobacter suwonensis TaxID=332999 RepID=UPI0011A88E85|nr:hypothetical protein [Pedobacter suwonensis]